MERTEIMAQVQEIFRTVLKNEAVVLTEETTAEDVPGWDSLTHVELIATIEKHFGIRFSIREMLSWKTVGKMVDCVAKKIG
jgi:acyl carrier protein